MTLLDVIKKLEEVAINQPQVREIVPNDVYKLNERADASYGVFAWTQGQHVGNVNAGTTTFVFNLFYIDRLTNDKKNKTEIQSVGIQVLNNILQCFAQFITVGDLLFQPFTERFADECAGAYCTVSLTVPNDTICEQIFN